MRSLLHQCEIVSRRTQTLISFSSFLPGFSISRSVSVSVPVIFGVFSQPTREFSKNTKKPKQKPQQPKRKGESKSDWMAPLYMREKQQQQQWKQEVDEKLKTLRNRSTEVVYKELQAILANPLRGLNTWTYNFMLDILRRHGLFTAAIDLFKDMPIRGAEPNERTFNLMINACHQAGWQDRAFSLFSKMPELNIPRSSYTYGAAINACGDNYQLAIDLLEEMVQSGVEVNTIIYTSAIRSCEKGGSVEDAIRLFNEMGYLGIERNTITYNTTIQACSSAGYYNTAMQMFQRMKENKVQLDKISYLNAIRVCAKQQDCEQATELFREMTAVGIPNCTITYNAVLSAFGGKGMFDEAEILFMEMRANDVPVDVITYCTMISVCGDAKMSKKLLKEMKDQGIQPNTATYNEMIKQQEWEDVIQLFIEMSEGGVVKDSTTIGFVLNSCQSVEHLQVLEAQGFELTAGVYLNLINRFASQGDGKKALEFLANMETKEIATLQTYTSTITALKNTGNVRQCAQAVDLFNQMKVKLQPDVHAYTAAISACKKTQWGHALEFLAEMREQGLLLDNTAYTATIIACCSANQWQTALDLFERMKTEGVEPDMNATSAAMRACNQGFLWQRSLELLGKIEEKVEFNGWEKDYNVYRHAMTAYSIGEQFESVLELADEMEEIGLLKTLEVNTKDMLFSLVCSACEYLKEEDRLKGFYKTWVFEEGEGKEKVIEVV